PLTGFSNIPAEAKDCNSKGPCTEVFEYAENTGRLVCASCNPTGQAPTGPSSLALVDPKGSFPQPLSLASNGRLFFNSYDSLSVYATNAGFENVYEYEPDGLGSCNEAGGCVFLISPGHEDTNASFVTAT